MKGSKFRLHMEREFMIDVVREKDTSLEDFVMFLEKHKWYMGGNDDVCIQVSQIKAIEKLS